jgi:predicted HicB family RNase H-like nuclease
MANTLAKNPKVASDGLVNVTIRVTPKVRSQLAAAATANKRSVSAEVAVRIEKTLAAEAAEAKAAKAA